MGLTSEGARAALARFIAERAGARAARVLSCERLAGGAVQENFALEVEVDGGPRAGRHALVLRAPAPAAIAMSLPRAAEFRVLAAARKAGISVPEPFAICEEAGPIGRPFTLARRLPGIALGGRVVRAAGERGFGEALARRLAEELAAIHRLSPADPELGAVLGPPPADPARHSIGAFRAYLDTLAEAYPALEWGLRRCELAAPPPGASVLCHGDFRTGNYLVEEGRLAGVLDWEFAHFGDPHEDLAWFCARSWRFGADALEAGGIAPRAVFVSAYERASGRRVEAARLRFWEVMANLRWAVIALQQCGRHLSGAEPSLELALIGRRVPEMELEVLALTGEGSGGWR